jgi:hypothetical protein
MKNLKLILIISLIFSILGCANYKLTSGSLVEQLKQNQKIEKSLYYQQFSLVDYPSNNLQRIKCVNKSGKNVWLYPDKNTEFVIQKTSGKKVRAYFDTVIFQNDTLFGLRSRLLGGIRVIPVKEISNITIKAEFPKTEMADD